MKLPPLRVLEQDDLNEIGQWFDLDPNFPGDFSPFDWKMDKLAFLSKIQETIIDKNDNSLRFYAVPRDNIIAGLLLSIKPTNFNYFEIGYYLLPSERGKGLATNAVTLLIDQLFKSDIHRIEAGTSSLNVPSQKLLEKLGFMKEAVRRKTLFRNGSWEDSYLYALVR